MQQFYLRWHGKRELRHILQALCALGYKNIHALSSSYQFPVIVVDCERKIFYESHASYMAAHLVSGTLKLYDWENLRQYL